MMPDEEGKRDIPKARPPETPPPIITQQVQRRDNRQWLMLLIYLVVALLVAGGVVLGGRWVYHQVRDEPAQETTITSDRTPQQSATTSNQPSPTPPPTPTPTPTPAPATRGSQIANTGPGEAVALFVIASIAAAGLHYIVSLRRAS